MAIKLLTGMATASESFAPGDIVTLTPEEEKRMVERGFAEKIQPKRGRPAKKAE